MKKIISERIKGKDHWNYGKDKWAKEKAKPAPLCKCECGKKVKWCLTKNRYNKYINGHWQKGKKFPEQSKRMKENNPMQNPEYRKKISKANKGKKYSKEFCKNQSKIQLALGKNHPWRKPEFLKKKSKKYLKEGNPNWKGGISYKPYCYIWTDQEYKQSIRDRDNNECQNPNCKGICNHLTLCIHHIDGNKLNCHPWNLISVCRSCNKRAEGNKNIPREWWQNLYQGIMTRKYGYEFDK